MAMLTIGMLAAALAALPFDVDRGAVSRHADPTGCPAFEIAAPRPAGKVTVSALEFGFSPTNLDNGAAIEAAVRAAKARGAAKVTLAPGVYPCYGACGVLIEDMSDFELDGCGAELVFRRPPTFPMVPSWDHDSSRANFLVRNCRRTRIGRFDMDWDWKTMPLATCSRVVAVHVDEKNDNASYCDFDLVGHGERHALYGKPFPVQRTQPMTADFKRFLKGPQWWHGTYEGDMGAKAEWLSPTRVRVYPAVRDPSQPFWDGPNRREFSAKLNRAWAGQAKVGDAVRIAHAYYGKGGFTLDSNSDFELHDVKVYSCFGHAIYVDGSQTRWAMRNVSVAPRDWRHPISSTADAVHFVRSHGKAVIDNLTVKLESDDAINVHDRFTVAKRAGERELEVVLERQARYFTPAVGDTVELRDPGYNALGWFGKVVRLDGERIVFDRPVPERDPAEGWFLVFDRTASSDGVIIRNCTFEDMEMRTLVNVSDATVENCRFVRTNGDALRCLADYTLKWWAEGMGATNIVVRNCTFDSNCVRELVGSYYSLGADFATWLGRPDQVATDRLNRRFVSDILVEGCTFRDSLGYFADLRFGTDIVFRGNVIERTGRRAECRETSGSARLERVANVTFENNTIIRPKDSPAPRIDVADGVENVVLRGNRIVSGSCGFGSAEVHVGFRGGRETVKRMPCTCQPDGAWRFRMRAADIPREAEYVDVFTEGSSPAKGEGYWVTGDSSYGKLNRDAGDIETRRLRLPLFGAVTPEGAFVAIVKTLRGEFSERVRVRAGRYEICPRFKIGKIEFAPYEDIVVDYYPLEGADANYSGMARKYRAWQLARGEVKPLREKIRGNDALKWSTESIFLRCKFGRTVRKGIDPRTFLTEKPPMNVDHTFDGFMDIMRRCKRIGLDAVDMCMVGWQPDGHDGPFPDLFPPDERFGGEAKMREAIALGKSLGYRMSVHVNWHNYYLRARRYREEDVCKGPDGRPRPYAVFRGLLPAGPVYDCCWEVMCNRYVDSDIAKLLDLGLDGILHMDVASAEDPVPCHDPRHSNSRAGMIRWQREIAAKARRAFGGASSESSYDHFASELDNILYVVWAPCEHPLCDGTLPLFPIAYNGIIMSQPYYATIDAPCARAENEMMSEAFKSFLWIPTPEERMLKVFEWGGRPAFYYALYTDDDLAAIKRMYDLWLPLRHLQLEFIREHAELAPGVTVTRYENGEEVVCNATKEAFAYRGNSIPPLQSRLLK